jgi:hypothetical protein
VLADSLTTLLKGEKRQKRGEGEGRMKDNRGSEGRGARGSGVLRERSDTREARETRREEKERMKLEDKL